VWEGTLRPYTQQREKKQGGKGGGRSDLSFVVVKEGKGIKYDVKL